MQTNSGTLKALANPEIALLAAVAGLILVAVAAPAVVQPVHQHAFADQRLWLGIPFAGDVLSNLAFALWAVVGWLRLRTWMQSTSTPMAHKPAQVKVQVQQALVALFFVGLLATALGSTYYHWQPENAGLALDRLGMVVAFAGLIGLAAAGRISDMAGICMAGAVLLVLGPASIGVWLVSANILPWVVLQAGGMALIVGLAFVKPLPGALPIRWGWVIAIYAVAKVFEHYDHAVLEATQQLLSGHSIKHTIAACAAWPVVAGLGRGALSGTASFKKAPTTYFQASNVT